MENIYSLNPLHSPPHPSILQPERHTFIQNYRVPYRMCPHCGGGLLRIDGVLTCSAHHLFYECPTCLDTRISDQRENIMYCKLLHPYHICVTHQVPVIGIVHMRHNKCTCNMNPSSIIRKTQVSQWQSAFL